jgi:hypothetical protein
MAREISHRQRQPGDQNRDACQRTAAGSVNRPARAAEERTDRWTPASETMTVSVCRVAKEDELLYERYLDQM